MRFKICIIASLLTSLLTSCKDNKTQSDPNDFAFSATAKNFAIMAGYSARNDMVVADIANWENLIKREQLGIFTPVYVEKTSATVARLKAAFKQVGSEMTENSTIVFAFSGPGKGGKLVADQEFTYVELAAALKEGLATNTKVKKARRFYMFIESNIDAANAATADTQLETVFTSFNTAERNQSLFQEALIFGSTYVESTPAAPTTTPATNNGRFSFEFVKSLDLNIQKIRSGGERPTLRYFFDTIVSEVGKNTGRKSSYRLKPDILQKETLFPASFVPPNSPTSTPTPSSTPSTTPAVVQPNTSPTPTTPAQPVAGGSIAPSLNLPMQSASGPTNLTDQFKGNTMLIEISASWCGPCQSLAQTIAEKTYQNASIASGKCSSAALLVTDDESTLEKWAKETSPAIAAHSFQVGSGENMKGWLGRLKGIQTTIEGYPTVILIGRDGTIQSVSSKENDALKAFLTACP